MSFERKNVMSMLIFLRRYHWLTAFFSIVQIRLSLILALYISVILNFPLWEDQFQSADASFIVTFFSLIGVFCVTLFLCLLSALFGQWGYRFLTSLLVLFSAAAAYYMIFFHVVIGYGVVAALFTTEMELSKESFGWKFIFWLIITAGLPIAYIWAARLKTSCYTQLTSWRTAKYPVIHMVTTILVMVGSLKTIDYIVKNQAQDQLMPSAAGTTAHRYLPTNWIAGLGMVAYHEYEENFSQHNLFAPAAHFNYQLDPEREDTMVIFVIGETTRSDHLGILGYERQTTPLLAQEKNLIAMRGLSCDTATSLSLRCMFVREGGTSNDDSRQLKEVNIFATLKALGFSSELFAMQGEAWFYNKVNADNYLLREMVIAAKGNAGKPMDDMLLIPLLKQSISAHTAGKHLVILHTKGSHYAYSQRYPRAFANYTPECFDIDDACNKQQLVNAFDNSVLYIDTFLKNVIDQVRDRKAIIFYSADHGESIDDNMHFHATPLAIAPPEQRRVPMMVWMSDAFIQTSGGKTAYTHIRQLQKTGAVRRHEELFDSVLGCTGFTSSDGGIVPANNWCQ